MRLENIAAVYVVKIEELMQHNYNVVLSNRSAQSRDLNQMMLHAYH